MSYSSMSYRSSASGSPSGKSKVTSRPSLVILSGDDVITPFMKRRYNPMECRAPDHIFGLMQRGESVDLSGDDDQIDRERQQLEELERQRWERENRNRRLADEDFANAQRKRQEQEEARLRKEQEDLAKMNAKQRRLMEERRKLKEKKRLEEEQAKRREEIKKKREEERRRREEAARKRREEEEERRRIEEEERRKREEEERRLAEERRRIEEERRRIEEEERRKREEEERRLEEERRKREEEERRKREEEERKRLEEERRRLEEEERERRRREEEEERRRLEEEKRRLEEEERERKRREEEEERRRREEEERKRKEEEARIAEIKRKEQEARDEEERRRLEQQRIEEEERRRRQAEEEERRRQEEAERRRLAAEERQRKREEELKRMQEELKRKRKEERRKRKEEQRRKQEAIEKARLAMEEQRRKREEEERRRQEEEERRRQEEEERRRREEEERRRLAAEWDEDFNVNFDDFDALSNGTSAWSVFMDGEKFNKKIRKQLNFDAVPGFAEMFDDMDMNARRRLGRVARLQAVQKKKWLSDVWRLFDLNFSPEALWMTLKAFANDDGTALNGLLASAKRIANRFMRFSSCGSVSIHMRAMITGPHFGGKTTFLRAVFLYILNTLVNTGGFKNVLIIPMDARDQKKELKTREGFYAFVSNAVIRALLAERPDLQLFSNSLQKAFSQLLVAPKVRRLPKPISSQDYLRRPMKMVDSLLTGLHKLYHDPKGHKMFLEEVATLPKTIGDIFGFPASIVVFDHVDEADVTCNNLHLFEFMKRGLAKTQFMLSGTECERVYDMLEDLYPKPIVGFKPMTSIINITDVCQSQNEDRVIEITFENKEVPSIWMDSNYCGGCPTFVSRFDDICKCLSDYSEMPENQKRKETMIVAVTKMEILLDLVMSFGKYQDQDGGPPRVKYLDMIFKDELKERQEAVREACKAAREQQKQQARDVNATEDVPDGYVEEKQPDDVVEESVDADDEGSGTDEDPQQGVESEGDGNEPGNEEEANAEEEPVQEEAPIQDDVKHSEEEEPVQGEAPIRDDVKHSEEEEPVQEEVPVQDDVKHSEKEEPVEEEVPIQDDVKHSEEEEPVREEAPIEEDDRTPDGVEHSEEEELVQEQAPIEEEQIQDHLKQLDEEEESVHEEVPIEEENIPDDVKQPEEEDTLLEEEPAGGDQGVHAALEPLDDEDASIGEEDLTDDGEGLPDDLQLSDDEEDFVPE